MSESPSRDEAGWPDEGSTIPDHLRRALASLVEALVRGIYLSIALYVIAAAAYVYMALPAGAWTLRLSGLGREATLGIAAGMVAALQLGALWLAVLCFVVFVWMKDLGVQRSP